MNNRELTIEHIDKMLLPAERNNISLGDVTFHWTALKNFANEFFNRYEFKVGTRVRLKKAVEKTENNTGWHGSLHFLQPWNTGEVREISYISEGVVSVSIKWNNQSYIPSMGEHKGKEVPLKEFKLYCHKETGIELAREEQRQLRAKH